MEVCDESLRNWASFAKNLFHTLFFVFRVFHVLSHFLTNTSHYIRIKALTWPFNCGASIALTWRADTRPRQWRKLGFNILLFRGDRLNFLLVRQPLDSDDSHPDRHIRESDDGWSWHPDGLTSCRLEIEGGALELKEGCPLESWACLEGVMGPLNLIVVISPISVSLMSS